MTYQTSHDVTQGVFRALADPTRRAILQQLRAGPKGVNALAQGFEMSRPAVAKHLKILEEGRLITVEQRGRERLNHLQPEMLALALRWFGFFDGFWDDRLAGLKHEVERDDD